MVQENQSLFSEDKKPQFIVRVAVPLALPKVLDYLWVGDKEPQVGAFAEVEVGRKKYHSVVMEIVSESKYDKLKTATPIEMSALSPQTAQFYGWVSKYTLAMPGDPIRAALVGGQIPEKPNPQERLVVTGHAPDRKTKARTQVLETAVTGMWRTGELADAAGVSDSVVRGLVQQGCLKKQLVPEEPFSMQINLPELNPHQEVAAGEIAAALESRDFSPYLLDGVMGSGKTEVYFDAIARVLERGEGQVLVLVPEISLTPQWLDRFKVRFGFEPTIWHSHISDGKRRKNWWDVLEGKARVVVGARSALFLPYQQLEMMIVDEEHDHSYKQEDVFRYHGRDMAVVCASIWKCPIILASATPSLETWKNTMDQKYGHLILPSRHGDSILPKVRTVDMKNNAPKKRDKFISPLMERELARRLSAGEQSLVFLNRRGVAPLLICSGCGHRQECPSCSASLVVHGSHLQCHHCGFTEGWPEHCPKCNKKDTWRAFGPGTRKILQELEEMFPEARLAVADSDAVHTEKQMEHLVHKMESGQVDILVGTQMVAKGHHFANLTFVGVVDSDMGLAHGELRAAERTFQLLMQVAGRAGRESKNGEVMLQSYSPDHPLFEALKTFDREAFYNMELVNRKQWSDPPYGKQVALILSGEYEAEVQRTGQMLVQRFPQIEATDILGPAPAPLAKLKDRYRFRLLVKGAKPLQGVVSQWLNSVEVPRRVRIQVDVDPITFF